MQILPRQLILLVFLLCPWAVSCSSAQDEHTLNPHAYKAAINQQRDELLFDVRTPEEYSQGHLKDAENINWQDASFETQVSAFDKAKPVFIYCKSGKRSSDAAKRLREMGFTQVYNLEGGIAAWQKAGFKVETGNETEENAGMSMEQYHQLLNSEKLVLVDFYATWCGPCKKLSPILKEIAQEQADVLELRQINSDNNITVCQELNIMGLPTLLLYKNQNLVWSHTGYLGKSELLKKISTFN